MKRHLAMLAAVAALFATVPYSLHFNATARAPLSLSMDQAEARYGRAYGRHVGRVYRRSYRRAAVYGGAYAVRRRGCTCY